MRAILIDPFTKTVSEVTHNGDYRNIYKLIDCQTFTIVYLDDNGETLFVDDEGLLHEDRDPPQQFFHWRGYAQPLAGKGLILGSDEEGETIGTKLSLEHVKDHVTFPDVEVVGWTPVRSGTMDHPVWGETAVIHGAQPIFEPKTPVSAEERQRRYERGDFHDD